MPAPLRLAGLRFGKLIVDAQVGTVQGKSTWRCSCDCGGSVVVRGSDMVKGATTSCGCARSIPWAATHGHARRSDDGRRSAEYTAWSNMRARCRNPKNKDFGRYGGRGIVVCERWDSFEDFFADMGRLPTSRHTIERIDNDGNYEPTNCRWATRKEQSQNTSRTRRAA